MSSSAYPTSIPSSNLVTRDRSAIDDRIGIRRQHRSDAFSVGLIPQLIDVLRILAEGQDLLSCKIRAARIEGSSHSVPILEHLERFQVAVGQPIVGTGFPTDGVRRTPPTEDTGFDWESARANTHGSHYGPDPGTEVGDVDTATASVLESAPPSDPTAVGSANTTGDPSSVPITQPVLLDLVPPTGTTTSPLRRDYNFFDELDARLATLHDPTD